MREAVGGMEEAAIRKEAKAGLEAAETADTVPRLKVRNWSLA
jgi:hypothetical protein